MASCEHAYQEPFTLKTAAKNELRALMQSDRINGIKLCDRQSAATWDKAVWVVPIFCFLFVLVALTLLGAQVFSHIFLQPLREMRCERLRRGGNRPLSEDTVWASHHRPFQVFGVFVLFSWRFWCLILSHIQMCRMMRFSDGIRLWLLKFHAVKSKQVHQHQLCW